MIGVRSRAGCALACELENVRVEGGEVVVVDFGGRPLALGERLEEEARAVEAVRDRDLERGITRARRETTLLPFQAGASSEVFAYSHKENRGAGERERERGRVTKSLQSGRRSLAVASASRSGAKRLGQKTQSAASTTS